MPTISFARGNPSPDILPVEAFADCARTVILREGRTILNYGPAGGYAPLREHLAAEHGVEPSQVILSTGSLTGFNFLMRVLVAGGGKVVVEAPSYDRTIGVFRGLGAEIVGVPITDAGLDLERLERELARGPVKVLHTIPTFQNPSGRTLPLENRRALVDLARTRGFLIYEDDPYRLVRYSGEPQPSMFELAGGENVIFSTSFSKTGAPGLRVGYMVVPASLVKPIETIAASMYIGPPLLNQAMLLDFIRRGLFEPNLKVVCDQLRKQRDAMLAGLAAEMPQGTRWSRPDGGYFLWVDLPDGVEVADLAARAETEGVQIVKGTDFYADGSGRSSMRLAFSFPGVADIQEGCRRLGAAVKPAAISR
jgi:DNA-binding transcriptional MocR family regulator